MPTDKCTLCLKQTYSNCRAIKCVICLAWFHLKCSKLSRFDFNYISTHQSYWICIQCNSSIFPFFDLTTDDLLKLSFNSNSSCLCSSRIDSLKLDSLPCFDIVTSLSKIQTLNNIDIDQQLPNQTNFSYYSIHDFHDNSVIRSSKNNNSFSLLHCNIRSLVRNSDKLYSLLHDLQYPFSIIGLSETKIKSDQDLLLGNISLPGYDFLSQPTLTNAGGVGVYVNANLKYSLRQDLCISKEEFEALWIEIENSGQNII